MSPLHIICTMRTKIDWVLEKNENGKLEPRKVGLAPVQREGVEYEFDLLLNVNEEHVCSVSGSRCRAMNGKSALEPGASFFAPFADWLTVGTPQVWTPAPQPKPAANGDGAAQPKAARPSETGLENLASQVAAIVDAKNAADAVAALAGAKQDTAAPVKDGAVVPVGGRQLVPDATFGTPEYTRQGGVSDRQLDEIDKLSTLCCIPAERFHASLKATFGVESVLELSQEQAKRVISKLAAMYAGG
jgi:hypothetical protein